MRRLFSFAVLLVLALSGRPAIAQDVQSLALAGQRPRFLAAWAVPGTFVDASNAAVLQRRVSLDVSDVPLSVALRELARQARLDLGYNKALLPVGRTVSLHVREITVVAALTEVLLNSGLDVAVARGGQLVLVASGAATTQTQDAGAVVGRVTDKKTGSVLAGATVVVDGTSQSATTGNDGRYRIADVASGTYTLRARYIGYAPGVASVAVSAGQEATADLALEKSAQRLDEVVTTGTVVPTEVKALPTPISVVTADDIEQQHLQRVDQIFRGQVPGAVAFDQGPGNDYYSYVSVRGASSLSGLPAIKTFVDGVEVADPTLIATIDANSVDRIEITRGPQASTLYGAGALNGVMQIFTKKGQLGLTRPEVTGRVSVGGVGGFDDQSTALQTDNTVSLLGGGEKTSYSLGGSYRHAGDWVPSYRSTDWSVAAGGQTTQGPFTLSSSLRYADKTFDSPWDTRLQSFTLYSQPFYQTNVSRQQTYGVTASVQPTRSWRHTLTLGYDQSYFDQDQTRPRFTTPADSFLSTYAIHEAKISLLYHTDLSFRLGAAVAGVATVGVNYDAFDYVFSAAFGATHTTGSLDGSAFIYRAPWANTGYFGNVQFDLAERLFLTAGLRAERNGDFGASFGTAWSPRVGAAYTFGFGPARVKLRASYGESIRAPAVQERDAFRDAFSIQLANPNLAPERQRGADGGVEVYVGRASVGVTYYNQRALDLIDFVSIPALPGTLPTYQYQNISLVRNEGWEFEARLPLGLVQLTGTYSITNSTVQQLPLGYGGDLQLGDQILGIPYTTAGVSVTYSPLARTTVTASMTYIGHWTGGGPRN